MNIWSKLITALRGGVNEMGENIAADQALRILDQEIRDADNELKQSKSALAEIMAKSKLAEETVKKIQKTIEEYETFAVQAIDKGEDDLALEIAEKITRLEVQQKDESDIHAQYAKQVEQLRHTVSHAEGNLKRLKQQADTVRATESVQRAQAAVASRYSNSQSGMRTAMDSLERIKQKQAENQARLEAEEELALDTHDRRLDAKLKAAGILDQSPNAQAVLERLKSKK